MYSKCMMRWSNQRNVVEVLGNDIIYVQKIGVQTERSQRELLKVMTELSAQMRAQNKRVLILINTEREGVTTVAGRRVGAEIGTTLDYDKGASFNASVYGQIQRKMMAVGIGVQDRVSSFPTMEEALEWLLLGSDQEQKSEQ